MYPPSLLVLCPGGEGEAGLRGAVVSGLAICAGFVCLGGGSWGCAGCCAARGWREEEEEEEGYSPGLTSLQHSSFSLGTLLVVPAPALANLLSTAWVFPLL